MSSLAKTKIKFMTYNVWSCEHVAVYRRIQAISELIWRHEPDVIFLQVTNPRVILDLPFLIACP